LAEETLDFGYNRHECGAHRRAADAVAGRQCANTSWIPDSTVIDAMFGYYAKQWDAQIGIKNIANVEYFTIAESAGGFVGEPRTYYVKASLHY
jgi:outer membrane receptor protein involved in Fe transport